MTGRKNDGVFQGAGSAVFLDLITGYLVTG